MLIPLQLPVYDLPCSNRKNPVSCTLKSFATGAQPLVWKPLQSQRSGYTKRSSGAIGRKRHGGAVLTVWATTSSTTCIYAFGGARHGCMMMEGTFPMKFVSLAAAPKLWQIFAFYDQWYLLSMVTLKAYITGRAFFLSLRLAMRHRRDDAHPSNAQ